MFDRGEIDFKYSQFTGNLDTLIAPADTTSYSYDGSLVTSVTKPGERTQHLNYFYDNNFHVTDQELWVTNPDANDYDLTTSYTYDNDGLITGINLHDQYWNPVAPTMNITYNPSNGLPASTSLGNMYTGQTYNEKGELDSYEADYNSSAIFHTNYTRDSLGRITQINEIADGRGEKKNYTYDIAGRLWKVWRNDTLVSTYSYDPNGNRIAHVTRTSADSGTYDAQDRLVSYSSTLYFYTSIGNLSMKVDTLTGDTTRFSCDALGVLKGVTLPNGTQIEYIIDGLGKRVGRKVNGVLMQKWLYSSDLRIIAELDSANNIVSRFVYVSRENVPEYFVKSDTLYRIVTDQLGSVRQVVNVITSAIIQKIDYDEFGNVLLNTNPDFQPFGYAGGLYDTHTKLVRFWIRDYEPETGRWTCKDPIKFKGKTSNLYEYCLNDPINNR